MKVQWYGLEVAGKMADINVNNKRVHIELECECNQSDSDSTSSDEVEDRAHTQKMQITSGEKSNIIKQLKRKKKYKTRYIYSICIFHIDLLIQLKYYFVQPYVD